MTTPTPAKWPNNCNESVPAALRYLAENDRPTGGEQLYNAAHLYQLADEIKRMAAQPLYAAPAATVDTTEPDRLLVNKWTILDRLNTLAGMTRDFADGHFADVDREIFLRLELAIRQATGDFTTEVHIRMKEQGQ